MATTPRAALSLALFALLAAGPHAADASSPFVSADVDRLARDLDSASRKLHTEVDDGTVARNVGRDIVYGIGTEVSGLFVTSEDGIVTLKGTVETEETREIAISRASRIAGVRRIINRLGTPGEEIPADEAPIVAAAERSDSGPIDFLTSEGLAGRDVVVVNDNGVVTLRGHVNNAAARRLAIIAAQRIDGVRTVVDHLDLIPVSRRNDKNLANIVRFRLGEIADLRDAVREVRRPSLERRGKDLVEVTVKDGVAMLVGRLPDAQMRDAMVARARATTGIFAVSDKLVVDGDARAVPRVHPSVDIFDYGTAGR